MCLYKASDHRLDKPLRNLGQREKQDFRSTVSTAWVMSKRYPPHTLQARKLFCLASAGDASRTVQALHVKYRQDRLW